MDNERQMNFDFSKSTVEPRLSQLNMKRAALAWLISLNPSGISVDTPTRISKYKADVAAFWSEPRKKILKPEKTLIVETRRTREMCWPDCSEKDRLLPVLREKKEQEKSIQEQIRKDEPWLRDSDTLFDEIEIWNYEKSSNKDYPKCHRQIEEIEHALYKGSRFEQIRRACVADYLYLAVPEGAVHPDELADGWGLIFVSDDLKATVIKEADNWNCPESNRLHLIQNIAISSTDKLLFANGLRKSKSGNIVFTPMPRRRRG